MSAIKRIIALALCAALCFGCVPVSAAYSVQALSTDIAFECNSEPLNIETYNIDNFGFYKLRDIAAMCDGTGKEFSVEWNEERQMITLTSNGDYIVTADDLQPGGGSAQTAYESNVAVIVNGVEVNLTAYNINGYTYYKLRELCEVLDIYVSWNESTRTSGIDTTKNYDGTDFSESSAPEKVVLDSEQVYAKCSSSVFRIDVYDADGIAFASGSGFFIDGDGTAVTNYHVLDGAHSATAALTNGEVYDILGVYDYDQANDWAVIQIDCGSCDCLTIGDTSTIVGGAKIYALGSPLGLDDTFSDGMISNANRVVNGVNYIQISAPISHGSSGGALINKYGEVIGICSAGFVDGQNLNLALPITCISGYSRAGIITLAELFPAESGSTDTTGSGDQQLAYDVLLATIENMQTGIDSEGYTYYYEALDSENYVWFTDYTPVDGTVEVCVCYSPMDYDIEYWTYLYLSPNGEAFDYYIIIEEYSTGLDMLEASTLLYPPVTSISFDQYTVGAYWRDMESDLIELGAEMAYYLLMDALIYTDAFFQYSANTFGHPLCSVADFGFTY